MYRPSDHHMGFSAVQSVSKLVLYTVQHFWRACSAAILTLLLCYWLYGGVLIFILLCLAVCGAFYHYQDVLLYYPEQPESARVFVQTPNTVGLPYENVFLETDDGVRITGYFVPQSLDRRREAPTMLYFHGNAGNIGHRLNNVQAIYSYCGCNVLLLEYRGYGKSEGSPSENGMRLDAKAAMDYLLNREDVDSKKIIVFGRSLGGAVAIDLASDLNYMKKIFVLIVENTFTSIPMMATQIVPGLEKLPVICYRNQYLNIRKIRIVQVPTLFLSGLSDQMIPSRMMAELFQACNAPLKHIERFEHGTHNGTWQCSGYYEAINRFLSHIQQSSLATHVDQDYIRTAQQETGTVI
ncbi:protein ABHD13-like [Oscarella lobularis]|uniref:protein ABHD13-like n=1 Tax=Oscarella lobularis TaxID=121494 RepID=UPI0033138DA5